METKESYTVDETPKKKKRGRPSKRKPLVSGDGDEVAQTESATDERNRRAQPTSATDERNRRGHRVARAREAARGFHRGTG